MSSSDTAVPSSVINGSKPMNTPANHTSRCTTPRTTKSRGGPDSESKSDSDSSATQAGKENPFKFSFAGLGTSTIPTSDSTAINLDFQPKPPVVFGAYNSKVVPLSIALVSSTHAQRHDVYYFPDGNVVIQVDDYLFNLHRSILVRYSSVFSDLGLEHRTENAPLVIDDIVLTDFTRFLGVLYPQQLGVMAPKNVSEWESIMIQAHKWKITSLEDLASEHLLALEVDPVKRIHFRSACGRDKSIDLLPAFMDLSQREVPITVDEAKLLGIETFARLALIRETIRQDYPHALDTRKVEAVLNKLIMDTCFGQSGTPNEVRLHLVLNYLACPPLLTDQVKILSNHNLEDMAMILRRE